MASRLSENDAASGLDRLAGVQAAVRAGDWSTADRLSRGLNGYGPSESECEQYLTVLRQTLVMAKASRTVAAASLARVRAAAHFQTAENLPAHRQNFGDVAAFSHPAVPAVSSASTT